MLPGSHQDEVEMVPPNPGHQLPMMPGGDQDEAEMVPPHPGHQQAAASSVHYTTSCKHTLVLLTLNEIITRNMSS